MTLEKIVMKAIELSDKEIDSVVGTMDREFRSDLAFLTDKILDGGSIDDKKANLQAALDLINKYEARRQQLIEIRNKQVE